MKRLNVTILLLAVTLTVNILANAQNRVEGQGGFNKARNERVDKGAMYEKMIQQKHDYFQEKLQFSDDQMKNFWSIYADFDRQIFELHEQYNRYQQKIVRQNKPDKKGFDEDNLTDNEAMDLYSRQKEMNRNIEVLKEELDAQLLKVISVQKVMKLHRYEKKFMRQIMSKDKSAKDKSRKIIKDKK